MRESPHAVMVMREPSGCFTTMSPGTSVIVRDGELHGVTAELSIDNAPSLTVQKSVLGSVRILRCYQDKGKVPEAVIAVLEVELVLT